MRNKGWNPVRQLSFALFAMLGIVLFHFFVSTTYKATEQKLYTLSSELSPYYFLNAKTAAPNVFVTKNEIKDRKNIASMPKPNAFTFERISEEAIPGPAFMNVNYTTPIMPVLAPEEEEKVKEAVDATKKILQESEWKAVEKNYAEVLNTFEKMKLKSEYKFETDNVNWNKLETQLRLTYNQINWDNVNQKINTSLAQIKLDSLQQQITLNLNSLIDLEKVMKENNVNAIPDSDITIQLVQENQQKAKDQLQRIKTARVKKIIKL
jgi:hypothetical protein